MTLLGTVISTLEGPSTRGFAFVVANPSVRKGQFVVAEGGPEGGLIAVVRDLLRANRYFERAESVNEYEKRAVGSAGFLESLPVNEWEYVVADCITLGALQKNVLTRSAFPPAPGAKVRIVDEAVLKEFLGFDEKGLVLGKLLQHDVDVRVSASRMLQKHLAILGISGSGKSHFTSVLLEELLERKPGAGRPAVIVFDVHGEYAGFGDKYKNPGFADKTTVVKGRDVRIAFHKLGVEVLSDMLPEMSSTQARELEKILYSLKKQMRESQKAFDLKDAIAAVESSPALVKKENVKAPLLGWLGKLRKLKLFARSDNPGVGDLIKPGRLVVFDLSGITNQQKKQLILAYFCRRLFKSRREGSVPPFVILVEEAHSFAPEKIHKAGGIAKRVIETIAREGRKFGACLCLISQRPVQLSTTALSQANTYAIFKITNPYDLDHIQKSCEAIDRDIIGEITLLKTGEGIILGEAVHHPVFLRVRQRKSIKSGRAESLEQMAREFEELSAKQATAADVEQFI